MSPSPHKDPSPHLDQTPNSEPTALAAQTRAQARNQPSPNPSPSNPSESDSESFNSPFSSPRSSHSASTATPNPSSVAPATATSAPSQSPETIVDPFNSFTMTNDDDHSQSTSSTKGYGSTSSLNTAVSYMKSHLPGGIEADGSNWETFQMHADVAVNLMEDSVQELYMGDLKKPKEDADQATKNKYRRAVARLYAFFSLVVGPTWKAFIKLKGDEILPALAKRFGGSSTTAEMFAEYSVLTRTEFEGTNGDLATELSLHFDRLKEALEKTNEKFRHHRTALKLDNADQPVIPADLFLMVYTMSLPDDLRRIVFLHFNTISDVESLHVLLTNYLKNERTAQLGRESAFAIRSSTQSKLSYPSPSTRRDFPHSSQRRHDHSSHASSRSSPSFSRGSGKEPWDKGGEMKAKRLAEVGITITAQNAAALVASGVEEATAEREHDVQDSQYYTAGHGAHALFASPEEPDSWNNPFFRHLATGDDRLEPTITAAVARALPARPVVSRAPTDFEVARASVVPFQEPSQEARAFVVTTVRRKNKAPSLLSRLSSRSLFSRLNLGSLVPSASLLDRVTPASLDIVPSASARIISILAASTSSSSSFIFDTGASVHLTDDRSVLQDYEELPPHKQIGIGGAFGGNGRAIGRGTLVGDFKLPDGSSSRVIFKGVYYAPKLGHKLISGYQVLAAGFKIVSGRDTVELFDPNGRLVASMPIVRSANAIVVQARWVPPPLPRPPPSFSPPSYPRQVAAADAFIATDVNRWHERLGHAAEGRIRKMNRDERVEGLELRSSSLFRDCEACARGKFARDPVPQVATSRATSRIERLHSDVWGKAPAVGRRRGEQYVFGVVDDWSRMMWVKGLRTRDEVGDAVIDVVKLLQRQTGEKVKQFRRDGAREYNSRRIEEFFAAQGIVGERTVPYEHHHNGVVERRWRSIFDSARTALIRSGLPRPFWFLAVKSAVHVYNRLSTSANDDLTPFERYFGSRPSVAHLRTWGCVGHVLVDPSLRDKLAPRSRRCFFVGYLENDEGRERSGWLFYDPATKTFVEASQVAWFEDQFLAGESASWIREERIAIEQWSPMTAVPLEGVEGVQRGDERHLPSSTSQHDTPSSPLAPHPPASTSSSPTPNTQTPRPDALPSASSTSHRRQSPPVPPPNLDPRPSTPSTSPRTPPRRSARSQGVGPTHYVPLAGAPSAQIEQFSFQKGIRALAANPITLEHPLLASASLDNNLQEDDPDVVAVADIETDEGGELQAFITTPDPKFDTPSIREALNRVDRPEWLAAIGLEREQFRERGVMDQELVELPDGARAIPLKWVLLIKRDEHGNVIKYKARLVARGDLQRPGIDFGEVFSSTIRFSTILSLLALAVLHRWDVRRFDVTAAFLHGRLDDRHPIYIRQVPGFEDPRHPRLVHRLHRSIYGLRQAGRKWNETFIGKLKELGFTQSRADPSLFVRWRGGKVAIVPIHVDDGLVLGTDDLSQVIDDLSAKLDDSVKEEPLTLFLGVRIRRRDDGSISLDQRHYVEKLLDRFNFVDEVKKNTETPASLSADIKPLQPGEAVAHVPYREMLGALLYLAICTRPDLSYAVSVASRFGAAPALRHWTQLKRILRYAAQTRNDGLVFSPHSSPRLTGFTDADHAADPHTRRSISGWAFTLAGAAIDWQSKRQSVTAISSTEAEYYAFSSAVREAVWLRSLFKDIGFPQDGPTLLRADNRSMILLADHPSSHHRTKHFAVHASYSREKVASGAVQLEWIPTNDLPADMLTKALASAKHPLQSAHPSLVLRTLSSILGPAMEPFEDLNGEDIFDKLEEKYGSVATTAERYVDFTDLSERRLTDPEDLADHFEALQKSRRRLNERFKAYRKATGKSKAKDDVVDDDLFLMIYTMSLTDDLRREVFRQHNKVDDVEVLHKTLVTSSAPPPPGAPSPVSLVRPLAFVVPAPLDAWTPPLVRFRAPANSCFDCWEEGHYADDPECAAKGDKEKKGELKAAKLASVGIEVSAKNAAALVSWATEEERAGREYNDPTSPYYLGEGMSASAYFAAPDDPASWDSPFFAHLKDQGEEEAPLTASAARVTVASPSPSTTVVPFVPPQATAQDFRVQIWPSAAEESRSLFARIAHAASSLAPQAVLARVLSVLTAKASAPSSSDFIFDTGASIHLTDDRSMLHDYEEFPPQRQISIGGAFGGAGKAVGRGALVCDFHLPDGTTSRVRFTGVHYAPGLGHKLLSGTQVVAVGFTYFVDAASLKMYGPGGQLVAVMPLARNRTAIVVQASLLVLPSPPLPPRVSPSFSKPSSLLRPATDVAFLAVDLQLWHERLGHVGVERIRSMKKGDLAAGLEWSGSSPPSLDPCEACASGKVAKAPVEQRATRRAQQPLERLHSDVWGKAPAEGRRRGEQYALGVVDDFSRFVWVRGLRTRDLVGEEIPRLITMLHRQMEPLRIRRFRRDNAKEYTSASLNAFLDDLGIVPEPTVPYAHNHNGVAERVWRSVFDMARTWLLRSGLPRSFWYLAVAAAVHIKNRLPTSANDGDVSPYQRLFGSAPDVSYFRVWGCVAHVLIDPSLRDKLEQRTRRCYFVGYLETLTGDERKGWLFYDPGAKRFLEGVQVVWFERHFVSNSDAGWVEEERTQLRRWDPFEAPDDRVKGVEEREDDSSPGSPSHPVEGVMADLTPDSPPQESRHTNPPPRRSERTRNIEPSHFVPLQGAPPAHSDRAVVPIPSVAPFRFERGLAALAAAPITPGHPLLAGASFDVDLAEDDPSVSAVAEIELDDRGELYARVVAKDTNYDSPSIRTALNREDRAAWLSAMSVELEAFAEREVWDEDLVALPDGARAIPLKWVLLIKRDEHGHIIKYKARLVARGDLQRPGIDFGEVFLSTIRFSTILVLLALAVKNGWDVRRFDVTAAFLHGRLDDKHPTYVRQVPGFEDPLRPRLVRRLRRSLYGLCQAGRKWNEAFVAKLKGLGFIQLRADPSLFTRWRDGKVAIIPIHVDDGLVLGDGDLGQVILDLSASLDDSVKEEPLTLFLGVRIRRRPDGSISLDQRHYVEKLLERFDFRSEVAKGVETPASLAGDLRPIQPDEVPVRERYREMLGALLYLAICTRPDLSYAVAVASRFSAAPAMRHWIALKRILRYAAQTKEQGLIYQPSAPSTLTGFTDADHAADPDTRRSVTGWVFTLAGAAVDWQSKRQAVTAISSTEAEYYAFSSAVRKALWLRSLLTDLVFPPTGPTVLRADNRSMITLADHPSSHHRTKHFAVHASFSHERIASGEVQLEWLPTNDLPADMLTKPLTIARHRRFCEMVGLADCHLEGVCWRVLADGGDLESARWLEIDEMEDEIEDETGAGVGGRGRE
ncbi:hypothetical protein JCM5296_000044 [Sporobolomyces johnsonii]